MAHAIERGSRAELPDRWKGEPQCGQFGINSCLAFNCRPAVGGGPRQPLQQRATGIASSDS